MHIASESSFLMAPSELAQIPVTQPKLMLNSESITCPHCACSLVDIEIPVENRKYYGNKTHFSRVIGMSSLWFDRMLAYKCPDCDNVDVIPGLEDMWRKDQAMNDRYAAKHTAMADNAVDKLRLPGCARDKQIVIREHEAEHLADSIESSRARA